VEEAEGVGCELKLVVVVKLLVVGDVG
jgi:hypothetical protein